MYFRRWTYVIEVRFCCVLVVLKGLWFDSRLGPEDESCGPQAVFPRSMKIRFRGATSRERTGTWK